ncbi:tetratricopeptide repeat protein [Sorangium sp. So ce131]|uniref:tetratricopeptide repeat protein n=1 Tax=Sorangium sp. So ce131 TaxID=3133282 RepID=UPI003F5FFD40
MTTTADDEKVGGLMTSDLRDKILIAEGLRRDRKSQKAEQLFAQLENEEGLSSIQRRWIQAHHAAAILDQYLPLSDLEDRLDKAEGMLLELLDAKAGLPDDPSGAKVDYPWAWARLGDVYRQRGNLPSLAVTPSKLYGVQAGAKSPGVWLTALNNLADYKNAERCFEIALYQRPNYPWGHAHYAALLVNRRRYASVGLGRDRDAGTKCDEDIDKARKQINKALEEYAYFYPWALFYRGCVHFYSCLNTLAKHMYGNAPGDEKTEFLFMAYSIILALLQDQPAMYRHPIQPGAIGRDEYLSMAYDLFDFLPQLALCGVPPNDANLNDANSRLKFIEYIEDAVKAGKPVLAVDDKLPGSERVRFLYAELCLVYYKTRIPGAFPDPIEREKLISETVERARDELDSARLQLRGKALWTAPASGSQLILLRAFDVLMILLKIGVILKTFQQEVHGEAKNIVVEELKKVLDDARSINAPLGVLKALGQKALGQDEEVDVKLTLEKIANLLLASSKDNEWLLAPLWPLTPDRVEVLKEFLVFEAKYERAAEVLLSARRRPTQP